MNQEKLEKKHIPFHFAKRHGVFIQEFSKDYLVIGHTADVSPETLIELRRCLGCALKLNHIPKEKFETLLARAYETKTTHAMEVVNSMGMDLNQLLETLPKTQDLLESQDDAPIIRLLNALLTEAIKQSASDIHVETFEEKMIIRFRTDGVLQETISPPRVLSPLIISRIKVMAKLDIAEKRLPQDGRISLKIAGRTVDVRVSTIPTHYGERVVLRLLDKQNSPLDLKKLGMTASTLSQMQSLIKQPHGIILVTGPTGSGKTTTLYAALTQLNKGIRNILTIEDPVEYYLSGIGQMQVNTKINMTFAKGLRAILRQDPDIIMVGEIRDLETAAMTVQASLTGHLVLSTLHTNSAVGAVTRLRDMGIEPFLLSSTLKGVIAQRLIRLLCENCKKPNLASLSEKKMVYHAVGCKRCSGLGYQKRTGIYEIIEIDHSLRQMIHANDNESNIETYARKKHPSIRQDGFRRVIRGETSLEEVLRVTVES